ncbi:MAG: glutamine synthetase III [Chlamydiales bacterium]|nr:glutamine synthetase III [Chlamydiales bacterium]
MNARQTALRDAASRKPRIFYTEKRRAVEEFGRLTFSRALMEKILPKKVFVNFLQAIEGKGKINPEYADAIAIAMKDWAVGLGATHFCHWFQPLTGYAAEKQDAFIDWKSEDTLIEKFSGKNLLRGEPDASSFPSGSMRSTFEARGYTTWDPSSPAFLWHSGGAVILCIPSIFFSWTEKVLDMKIPLLRSDAKINQAALRLLNHLEIEADHVYSTVGCEQEYFLVDRALYSLRPDLLMGGRTVYGSSSAKSQELEDHYFGILKERVLAYMKEFEDAAFALGIPVKTRHNEVAPSQHEIAPIFEKSAIAVDHNLLLMELMRQLAARHDFACLLHEKPFAGINGSGKHNNWSLSTNTGLNLLDPTANPENSIVFLVMVTAVLKAVHDNSALLRASIASAGNDHRLGGHEAPPVIISVYLGEALEKVLNNIEKDLEHKRTHSITMDLGIPMLPELPKDETDRNRTSPFAFTGNKFEFRAVGSTANCALPVTILNVIVAESLNQIIDEIEKKIDRKKTENAATFKKAAMPVIRKYLKESKPIRFTGDNYSAAWEKEAKKRKLPIIKKSYYAFSTFTDKDVVKAFNGVLSAQELKARREIMVEQYSKVMNIEAKLMVEMFRTQILPAALHYQKDLASSLKKLAACGVKGADEQLALLKKLTRALNEAMKRADHLELRRGKVMELAGEKRGQLFCDEIGPLCHVLRKIVDELETLVDDKLWPLPKYRELLNVI